MELLVIPGYILLAVLGARWLFIFFATDWVLPDGTNCGPELPSSFTIHYHPSYHARNVMGNIASRGLGSSSLAPMRQRTAKTEMEYRAMRAQQIRAQMKYTGYCPNCEARLVSDQKTTKMICPVCQLDNENYGRMMDG